MEFGEYNLFMFSADKEMPLRLKPAASVRMANPYGYYYSNEEVSISTCPTLNCAHI